MDDFKTKLEATLEKVLDAEYTPEQRAAAAARAAAEEAERAGPVQVFCVNPGPPLGDKRLPVIDKYGRPVGVASAQGALLKIELSDRDMAKRLSTPDAPISIGYSPAGTPLEVAEAAED